MKFVLVTMRQDVISGRNETRDSLDSAWYGFLESCGLVPILVPNDVHVVRWIGGLSHAAGVILTGGGDISEITGTTSTRDAVETALFDLAAEQMLPVLGVCRGMQAICARHGGSLKAVSGHVQSTHHLSDSGRQVNSYHNYGIDQLPAGFRSVERSSDGETEAFFSASSKMLGIMWHPERGATFSHEDINLVTTFFKEGIWYRD